MTSKSSAIIVSAIIIIIIIAIGAGIYIEKSHKTKTTTSTSSTTSSTTSTTTSTSVAPSMSTTSSMSQTTTTTQRFKGVVKIGALVPLNLPIGKLTLAAIELAVNDINAKGGVLGYKVQLVYYDTRWSAEKAVEGYKYLVEQEKVVAVIGPYATHEALAIMNLIPEYKVVTISYGAVGDQIDNMTKSNPGLKYWFRANVNATSQSAATWDFLTYLCKTFNWKKIGLVYENLPWTVPSLKYGNIRSKEEGITVNPIIPVSPNINSFADVYLKLKQTGVKMFVYVFSGTEDFVMVRDFQTARLATLPVGGGVNIMLKNFWNQTKGAAQGFIAISWGFPTNITPFTMKFYNEYLKKVGIEPIFTAYYAYDAVLIWAQAVEKAGTFNSDAVVKVLENGTFIGVAGVYKFTKGHSALLGPSYIYPVFFQWQNGKRVVLWPLRLVKPGTKLLLPEVVNGKLMWKAISWPPKKGS